MRSTVSVLRTGSVAVSVDSLCSVPVKTWRSLYSLCLSPNPATDRGWVVQPSVRPSVEAAFRCLGYCRSTRGAKGSPNGTSVAMYPLLGFAWLRILPTSSRLLRCVIRVCSKNCHFRSISRTTDFGHLVALPFQC